MLLLSRYTPFWTMKTALSLSTLSFCSLPFAYNSYSAVRLLGLPCISTFLCLRGSQCLAPFPARTFSIHHVYTTALPPSALSFLFSSVRLDMFSSLLHSFSLFPCSSLNIIDSASSKLLTHVA